MSEKLFARAIDRARVPLIPMARDVQTQQANGKVLLKHSNKHYTGLFIHISEFDAPFIAKLNYIT